MASPTESEFVIAITLDAPPRIHSIPKGAAEFHFSGDRFVDVGLGPHNGFYDFLRSRGGEILGVRYLPSPDAEVLLTVVPEHGGLRFANDGQVRVLLIFWGENRDFDPETSSDQYFGDNAVYRGEDSGKLAIAFAVDLLSPVERASLPGSLGSMLARNFTITENQGR
jgi:hypothetical protein